MGNALDLVQSIETINGKIPKARGDLQFRVYVILRPDALQTLRNSTQFFRDRDNTVYHHGYPLNWRQDGGAPSIQISMAADGRHADIDVDYRSSKFPSALFNGHLTAANSDVRAGGNTQRHLQRWEGLTDWWRNLFGLDLSEPPDAETVAEATGDVPPVPRQRLRQTRRRGARLPDLVADGKQAGNVGSLSVQSLVSAVWRSTGRSPARRSVPLPRPILPRRTWPRSARRWELPPSYKTP